MGARQWVKWGRAEGGGGHVEFGGLDKTVNVQQKIAWQHRKAAASAVHADVEMDDISHST